MRHLIDATDPFATFGVGAPFATVGAGDPPAGGGCP